MPTPEDLKSSDSTILCSKLTHDIEEHAGEFNGWELQYNQLTPGQFEGNITELHLNEMQLIRDQSNCSMVKNGQSWDGAVTFSLPLASGDHRFYCEGHAINTASILVAQGRNLPEVCTPADLDLLSVAVDQRLLEETLNCQQRNLELGAGPQCYRMTNAACRMDLAMLATEVLDEHNLQRQALLSHEAIRNGIRDTFLVHMLDLTDVEEMTPLTPHARKRIVDRACEYALSHKDNPPSIIELCNHVGASRRKLQYCFQETLGTNPVTYLRTLRLNAAHRDLLVHARTVTVQDVAARWGFWHLSRFATDYRRLFGERPSETLQRASKNIC